MRILILGLTVGIVLSACGRIDRALMHSSSPGNVSRAGGWIRIVSFNAFLMPDLTPLGYPLKLSPHNRERLARLCDRLKQQAGDPAGADVVLLQEVWEPSSRRTIPTCGYPHVLDLDRPNLLIDSGLMVLSRWPLGAGMRVRYRENGFPSKIGEDGEFLAKKSFYSVRVRTPYGDFQAVNTHLVSFYDHPDRYEAQRLQQMARLAEHLREISGPWIVGGDLNFPRGGRLWDKWHEWLPGLALPAPFPACTVCGDNPLTDQDHGQLDHLFASPAVQAAPGAVVWRDKQALASGETVPLSDHYGWMAAFLLP